MHSHVVYDFENIVLESCVALDTMTKQRDEASGVCKQGVCG